MPPHTSNIAPRLWTPEEDTTLRRLKSQGMGRDAIARQLGRSVGSVESRMRKLHMVNGFSSSRPWSERNANIGPAGKPLDLGEGDARYVERCLDAGGFSPSRMMHGCRYFATKAFTGRIRTWPCP